jgi:phosphoribosylformylglycinamidine synthase subunit PurQ / glutaminase
MKFGVIVFPGSNCDHDVQHVLENVLQQEVRMLWHKDTSLTGFDTNDCIILPGGFSYGDYLRSGAIARFTHIMPALTEFANSGGWVWGICNGFQILCEAGLLPGALLRNTEQKYSCKNIYIKPANFDTAITSSLENRAYKIPIAHAEGRYYCDSETLNQLNTNGQVLFRYCDEHGEITEQANPNGSLENIAGICNATKNVFGMMPHPERASEDILGNTDGRFLFKSLLNYAAKQEVDVIDNLLS